MTKHNIKTQNKICSLFLKNRNIDRIVRKTKVPRTTVYQILRKNNIFKYYKNDKFNVKDFILLEKPEVIYFLGLMWADGTLTHYSLQCSLKISDLNKLKGILKKIGQFSFWKTKRHIKDKTKNEYYFSINNKKICDILLNYGFKNKSTDSPSFLLSKIPVRLHNLFYRGYLDGDGCISSCRIKFTSTINQDWSFLVKLCEDLGVDNFKINLNKWFNKKTNNLNQNSEFCIYNKNDRDLVFNYIYNGFEIDNIGLKRKYIQHEK